MILNDDQINLNTQLYFKKEEHAAIYHFKSIKFYYFVDIELQQ